MKLTKEDIGKTVYLVPTGNNIRRWGEFSKQPFKQVETSEIVNVKGVWFTLKQGTEHTREEKFRLITDSYQNNHIVGVGDCNAGYDMYHTLEEVKDQEKLLTLESKLKQRFCSVGRQYLTLEQAEGIAKILNLPLED